VRFPPSSSFHPLRLTSPSLLCSDSITSEERSLAFWLAEHGDYQVYLGNARGVFDMGHSWLKRSDPRFWGALMLSLFLSLSLSTLSTSFCQNGTDFSAVVSQTTTSRSLPCTTFRPWSTTFAAIPAMTRSVSSDTHHSFLLPAKTDECAHRFLPQIAFIGHSQGNATMFCSLGM
jgi:hypothetical protein